MKCEKLGQIFRPQDHTLPNGAVDYAQSPQALVLNDRVRIYFSCRSVDEKNKKFCSQIAYVDMDKKLETILDVSSHQVIPLGRRGTFDEHGIFPFSVFADEERVCAYTCGWSRRVSVSVETSTGFAESFDGGKTFQKLGNGPIFGATLKQPFLVGDSFVRKYDDQYHMWYMYGTKWVKEYIHSDPDRVYKIGYASSRDGINWTPQNKQIIPDVLHENECQALPSVLKVKDTYHMVFCYRDVFGFRTEKRKSYRIGYATSTDGQNWTRMDEKLNLSLGDDGDWDSHMQCYPHLCEIDGHVYLLYNGNTFGKFGFGAARLTEAGET